MNSTELSEAARYDLIARSGAFDEALYCRQLPGEALQGLPPLLHYMRIGEAHGLRPNADFDPAFYARTYALAERGAGAVLATHLLAEEPADRPTNAEQRAGRLAELGGFLRTGRAASARELVYGFRLAGTAGSPEIELTILLAPRVSAATNLLLGDPALPAYFSVSLSNLYGDLRPEDVEPALMMIAARARAVLEFLARDAGLVSRTL